MRKSNNEAKKCSYLKKQTTKTTSCIQVHRRHYKSSCFMYPFPSCQKSHDYRRFPTRHTQYLPSQQVSFFRKHPSKQEKFKNENFSPQKVIVFANVSLEWTKNVECRGTPCVVYFYWVPFSPSLRFKNRLAERFSARYVSTKRQSIGKTTENGVLY